MMNPICSDQIKLGNEVLLMMQRTTLILSLCLFAACLASALPAANIAALPDSLRWPDESLGRVPMDVPPTGYHIRIDKSEHKLSLYQDGLLLKSFTTAVGKGSGDKIQQSQWMTPEGNFYISNIHDASKWTFRYGKQVESAYGPWFLRLVTGKNETFSGKSWTGIGIHGTSRPHELGTHASHGCIRVSNDNIRELKSLIEGQFERGERIWVVIVP